MSSTEDPNEGLLGSGGAAGAPTADAGGEVPAATAGAGGTSAGSAGTGGGPATNLMPDPGFESGQGAWVAMGNASVQLVTEGCHGGSSCLRAGNRTQSWEGPAYRVDAMLTPGERYQVSAWVRSTSTSPVPLTLTTQSECSATEDTYSPITQALVGDEWTQLTGLLDAPTCEGNALTIFFDGAPPEAELFLDDVTLLPAD